MKVIVEHDEKANSYLGQYTKHIEQLSTSHKILDIEEKYLPWLSEITTYIEPNYDIKLEGQNEHLGGTFSDSSDMILVFIGAKLSHERIDLYYDMNTYSSKQAFTRREASPCTWIHCYSKDNKIEAVDYIKCMAYLCNISNELNKPIIIYASIKVPNETYRYRALTYKIINHYLKNINGVLITKVIKTDIYKYYKPKQKSCEFYLDQTIYVEECFNDAVKRAAVLLHSSENNLRFKEMYKYARQDASLYDDVFYESISPEQEIYVLLNSGNFREPAYYESLGLEVIRLIGNYSMLYAKKSAFDALRDVLKLQVAPQYQMPIVSYGPCNKSNVSKKLPYSVAPEILQYKGRGVYIGVIVVDGVDYTNEVLRNKDGTSRIAYIWEQKQADTGENYFKEQINQILKGEEITPMIKVPGRDSISTMMLSIAGGESYNGDYKGIATEAEFLVANINIAPEAMQRIYGGVPSTNGALMPDVLIGAIKLMNFATEQGRPIVLCVPFNANIDAHDGLFILNQILASMAQRPSVTLIAPAGEEADKMHHQGFEGKQEVLKIVNMRVEKESQNIVGVIYHKFSTVFSVLLYPPEGGLAEPIDLKKAGITRLTEQTTFYSNGEKNDFSNGAGTILFRLDNPQVGGWRIEFSLDTNSLSQIDIWLAQQELNPYTTLRPSSPFITIGSTAASVPIMNVGGYNKESMVVLRSSGRGFSWNKRVTPLFITHAYDILALCGQGEWVGVTSTVVAASIMLGVIATLYSKFNEEGVIPLPNTSIMNGIILRAAEQFQDVEYPNQSQGYGIFDTKELNRLLATPLIL